MNRIECTICGSFVSEAHVQSLGFRNFYICNPCKEIVTKVFHNKIYTFCNFCNAICICDRSTLLDRDIHEDCKYGIEYLKPNSLIAIVPYCIKCHEEKYGRLPNIVRQSCETIWRDSK